MAGNWTYILGAEQGRVATELIAQSSEYCAKPTQRGNSQWKRLSFFHKLDRDLRVIVLWESGCDACQRIETRTASSESNSNLVFLKGRWSASEDHWKRPQRANGPAILLCSNLYLGISHASALIASSLLEICVCKVFLRERATGTTVVGNVTELQVLEMMRAFRSLSSYKTYIEALDNGETVTSLAVRSVSVTDTERECFAPRILDSDWRMSSAIEIAG